LLLSLVLSLAASPEVYDFREVEEGEVVSAIFWLKNISQEDTVKIKSIRASCGCTYTTYSSEYILPGDSIMIRASLNTKGRSGEVSEYIKITTFSKQDPEIYLTLRGKVLKMCLDPEALQGYYTVILDVRSKESYEREHLVGSVWLSKDDFESQIKSMRVPKNILLIIVADSDKDRDVLSWLRKEGYGNSYMLRGGFKNWKRVMKYTLVQSKDF